MQQDQIEHPAKEAQPTETERKYGMFAASMVAVAVVGTVIYWLS